MIKFNRQLLINSANELGLNNEVNENNEYLIELFNHAQNWIRGSDPKRLPCCPPPEKHPYLNLCPINPEFKKYIIGTFPPITYQSDFYTNIQFCNGMEISDKLSIVFRFKVSSVIRSKLSTPFRSKLSTV